MDSLTVAAIGPVGSRLFLLQCRSGDSRLTLKVEKQQVGVLASHLARLVHELGRSIELDQDLSFEEDEPDWTVHKITIAYDEDAQRVILVLEELADDADEVGRSCRVSITVDQAAAFAVRATQLVEAGRPPCPLCGFPLDPSGHVCPRTNGHSPPVR